MIRSWGLKDVSKQEIEKRKMTHEGKKKENSTLNAKKPKTRGIRQRAQRRGWWIYELKNEWNGWLVETLKRG